MIVGFARSTRFTTPRLINYELQTDVSNRTIRRRLNEAGVLGRVARVEYSFIDEHIAQRLSVTMTDDVTDTTDDVTDSTDDVIIVNRNCFLVDQVRNLVLYDIVANTQSLYQLLLVLYVLTRQSVLCS
jgi:hypothetical protein